MLIFEKLSVCGKRLTLLSEALTFKSALKLPDTAWMTPSKVPGAVPLKLMFTVEV
jgi:hypothetical protein